MSKEKGRKWDGKSRVSNNTYRKRWNVIFNFYPETLTSEWQLHAKRPQSRLSPVILLTITLDSQRAPAELQNYAGV